MNKKVISIVAMIALVAVLGVCLVACNSDAYAKRLEKEGYKVQVVDLSDQDKETGIVWAVTAEKIVSITEVRIVSVTKCATVEDAEKLAEIQDKIYVVERHGTIVIAGTSEAAVKDAK